MLGKAIRAVVSIFFFFVASTSHAQSLQDGRFYCGGNVEAGVWRLWNGGMRHYFEQSLLNDRLMRQGDTAALYDFQNDLHNAVSMARRCDRRDRLVEVANLIRTAYGVLQPGTSDSPGRRWVCRGGRVCNETNHLINKEVLLYSVQFLALSTSVANALAVSKKELTHDERLFVRDTVQIAEEHLLRWSDKGAIEKIKESSLPLKEFDDESFSEYRFTDKHLWLIAIYAELAGITQSHGRQALGLPKVSDVGNARMKEHLKSLIHFFNVRTTFQSAPPNRLPGQLMADIDSGFWSLHPDHAYAGYEGDKKPAACKYSDKKKSSFNLSVDVPAATSYQRKDTGWDLSHARRLIHALDAIDRNRAAMMRTYSVDSQNMPSDGLTAAFSNRLVGAVWNGDRQYPLFSNYFSGANGWYRVAYDNGTGRCREGSPPYGLAISFLTGGYASWDRYNPIIGSLGSRLYDLTNSQKKGDVNFVTKYYRILRSSAKEEKNDLARFMFWPSLVEPNGNTRH